jgi:hypothetical protein
MYVAYVDETIAIEVNTKKDVFLLENNETLFTTDKPFISGTTDVALDGQLLVRKMSSSSPFGDYMEIGNTQILIDRPVCAGMVLTVRYNY